MLGLPADIECEIQQKLPALDKLSLSGTWPLSEQDRLEIREAVLNRRAANLSWMLAYRRHWRVENHARKVHDDTRAPVSNALLYTVFEAALETIMEPSNLAVASKTKLALDFYRFTTHYAEEWPAFEEIWTRMEETLATSDLPAAKAYNAAAAAEEHLEWEEWPGDEDEFAPMWSAT